jgi:hypothetical protein
MSIGPSAKPEQPGKKPAKVTFWHYGIDDETGEGAYRQMSLPAKSADKHLRTHTMDRLTDPDLDAPAEPVEPV